MHTVRGLGERRFGDVEEVEAVRNGVRRPAKLRAERESLECGKRVNGDLVYTNEQIVSALPRDE